MNSADKSRILSFVKEIDDVNLSKYVFDFKYNDTSGFESKIVSIYECLFKSVFLPRGYKIYVSKLDEEKAPGFYACMTYSEPEIFNVRYNILHLSYDDCEFLVKVDQETRNPHTHGTFKESDKRLKEKLIAILFDSLKNAYEYKTNKTLDISFDEFLEALKFSSEEELKKEKEELLEANKKLEEENAAKDRALEEKDQQIEELNKKNALSLKKKDVKVEAPKETQKTVLTKETLTIEKEIKYQTIHKNVNYILPRELGKNIQESYSSHIDVAFDFLAKGWFDETKKEVEGSSQLVANYILFLANNKLKNLKDLIDSPNYLDLLKELINLLDELPSYNVKTIINELAETFCNIAPKEIDKKIEVFKLLASITSTNVKKFKDNFIEYLIDFKFDLGKIEKGLILYFSSFKDAEYSATVIDVFERMLKKQKYSMMLQLKSDILKNFNDPYLVKLLFMAQAKVVEFKDVPSGLWQVYDPGYLSLLLNYDYYNSKDEFNSLKEWIISSIKNSIKYVEEDNKTSGIVLLKCVSQYLTQLEFNSLLDAWVKVFKNKKIWSRRFDDCPILIDLLKDRPEDISNLIKCWMEDPNLEEFTFYKTILFKAKDDGIKDETILKTDILLSLGLTNKYSSFAVNPTGITEKQVEDYLRLTGKYKFINELLDALTKAVKNSNADVYAKSFELLLSYCKEDKKEIFNIIKEFASVLVRLGCFDKAEKFYRIMLGLNINSSLCYWGLLFCKCNASNTEELLTTENLFDNELFQATLHTSKEQNPDIYEDCLSLLSRHKEYTTQKTKEEEDRRYRKFGRAVYITQFASLACFVVAGAVNAGGNWPFFLIAFLVFVSMCIFLGVFDRNSKKKYIGGTIILSIIGIALTSMSGIHIGKAANAEKNYNLARDMMNNIDSTYKPKEIRKVFYKIPTTYRDAKYLRQQNNELDDLMQRYEGRRLFNEVTSFSNSTSYFSFDQFFYNFNVYSLVSGVTWKVDDNSKYEFKYTGSQINYNTSVMPTGNDYSKEYYFYTEYDYYNDPVNHPVNQYMKIGFQNKKDITDKHIAYEIGDYKIVNYKTLEMKVYCYANSSTHTLSCAYYS